MINRWNDYFYENSNVMKNKLGIKDYRLLTFTEDRLTTNKALKFKKNLINTELIDTNYFKNIHKFLFGDLYEWAGSTRDVNMSKGNSSFLDITLIDKSLDAAFDYLRKEDYFLKEEDSNKYIQKLANFHIRLNNIHPFREGNGRATKLLMSVIALKKDLILDFTKTEKHAYNSAFIYSNSGFDLDGSFSNSYENIEKRIFGVTELVKIYSNVITFNKSLKNLESKFDNTIDFNDINVININKESLSAKNKVKGLK